MKEPKDAVLLAARIARAYPALSAYSAATLAEELCAIERAQRRHAERCCNGDYWKIDPSRPALTPRVHDPEKEERAERMVMNRLLGWKARLANLLHTNPSLATAMERVSALQIKTERQGDPRGCVLKVQFPGEPEASGV